MIYKVETKISNKIVSMFNDFDSTIVLSGLQGHMGSIWVDNLHNPTVAQIIVGIFVFYAGEPHAKASRELLNNIPDFALVIVGTEEWKKRIEEVHENANEKFQRYSFVKDFKNFDQNMLKANLTLLPEKYKLKRVDAFITSKESFSSLSEDFISQFSSVNDFLNRGIGFVILDQEKVVCGATSFSVYDNGIEIEIATHPKYRRQGLATIVASSIILYCLERNIYPNWDGANTESLNLAQKLGYKFDKSYDTFYIGNN